MEIASHVNGVSIGDARFEPFFAEAERLGAAIFVHALRPAGQDRIVGAFAEQAVCFPGDVALACASMITGGIASRHPKLRIAFSHGGGTMAILMPRLVHAWNVFPKAKESLPESPATIARRFFYDELVFDPEAVKFLVKQFGASQIVLGTDYPFALGDFHPMKTLESASLDAATVTAHHIVERAPLPRIAGRISLIEPGSTASATSSNAVGCALTMITFAPASRAMSTAPATG